MFITKYTHINHKIETKRSNHLHYVAYGYFGTACYTSTKEFTPAQTQLTASQAIIITLFTEATKKLLVTLVQYGRREALTISPGITLSTAFQVGEQDFEEIANL
jgi:hypothetical protein